jgi:thioredoxin-dependent peroxiredoxin
MQEKNGSSATSFDRLSHSQRESPPRRRTGCVSIDRLLRCIESGPGLHSRSGELSAILECEEVAMSRSAGFKAVLSSLGAIVVLVAAGAASDELKVGDKAPAFSLAGSDGKTYKLEDYKGKSAVVLAWFPKAKTKGCTKECKSLRDNSKALKALKVAYFTASVDKADDNKEFAESLELDYPILSDPDKTVAKDYGVLRPDGGVTNRWTFYIDKEGIIKSIDKKVDTEKAGTDVADKLKELGLAGE